MNVRNMYGISKGKGNVGDIFGQNYFYRVKGDMRSLPTTVCVRGAVGAKLCITKIPQSNGLLKTGPFIILIIEKYFYTIIYDNMITSTGKGLLEQRMFPSFVFLKISPMCCLILTLVTCIFNTFVYYFIVSLKRSLCC